MRIANWNVQRVLPAMQRFARIREALSAVSADVYVLTETHASLVPRDGFHAVLSAAPDHTSAPGERWASIWSSSPLETHADYVSDPGRCVIARLPHSEIGELIVYACVLPWGGSTWRGITAAGGAAFLAALATYQRDWNRLVAEFPAATLVVAGDFNQDLALRHYYGSRVQREALTAGLTEVGLRALTGRESDPIARYSPPCACIDHICINRGAEVTAAAIRWPDAPAPDLRLSDHFGVAVDLSRSARVVTTH